MSVSCILHLAHIRWICHPHSRTWHNLDRCIFESHDFVYLPLPQYLQEQCLGLWLSGRSSCPVGTLCPSLARTPSELQWRSLHYAPAGHSGTSVFNIAHVCWYVGIKHDRRSHTHTHRGLIQETESQNVIRSLVLCWLFPVDLQTQQKMKPFKVPGISDRNHQPFMKGLINKPLIVLINSWKSAQLRCLCYKHTYKCNTWKML